MNHHLPHHDRQVGERVFGQIAGLPQFNTGTLAEYMLVRTDTLSSQTRHNISISILALAISSRTLTHSLTHSLTH